MNEPPRVHCGNCVHQHFVTCVRYIPPWMQVEPDQIVFEPCDKYTSKPGTCKTYQSMSICSISRGCLKCKVTIESMPIP